MSAESQVSAYFTRNLERIINNLGIDESNVILENYNKIVNENLAALIDKTNICPNDKILELVATFEEWKDSYKNLIDQSANVFPKVLSAYSQQLAQELGYFSDQINK